MECSKSTVSVPPPKSTRRDDWVRHRPAIFAAGHKKNYRKLRRDCPIRNWRESVAVRNPVPAVVQRLHQAGLFRRWRKIDIRRIHTGCFLRNIRHCNLDISCSTPDAPAHSADGRQQGKWIPGQVSHYSEQGNPDHPQPGIGKRAYTFLQRW